MQASYKERRLCVCLRPSTSAAIGTAYSSLFRFSRGEKRGNGDEFLEFATALNLSAGGVLLATRRYLDPGSHISLEVPIALVTRAQLPRFVSLLNATVLRCTSDRQYFLMGLQFDEPLIREDRTVSEGAAARGG